MSNFFMLEFTKLSQKLLFELRSFRAEVDSAKQKKQTEIHLLHVMRYTKCQIRTFY